jgi:hypothetical protein
MKQLFTFLFVTLFGAFVWAQKDPAQMTDKRMDQVSGALNAEGLGWKRGGSLGLNINMLGILNPRLADGANSLAAGGIVNLSANNKQERSFWENSALFQLGVFRLGGQGNDFQKSADIVRINSTWGRAIVKDRLFFAIDGRAETQLMRTFKGAKLDGADADLLSQFFSPVNLLIGPGLVYKPNANLTFFASPAAAEYTYVGNADLRASGVLGNEPGEASRLLLGPALRAKYANKFLKDRIVLNSSLAWNSTYLDRLNGRVLWSNQINIEIFKGLGLGLLGEAFYDHYTLADLDESTAVQNLRYGTTYRGGFFLTYARNL